MSIRVINVGLLAGLVALLGAGAVAAAGPLQPADVLVLAARGSEAAVVAAADSQAAAAGVRRAQAWWWPTVSLAGTYTTRDHPQEVAAGPLVFPMGQQSNGQYQLELREILWAGGRRPLAVRASRRLADAAVQQGRHGIQQAQLAALEAYVQAISLSRRVAVVDSRLAALRAHLRTVRDLYDQGLVARNDLLETEVRVQEVADARVALLDRRAVAVARLNQLLGRDPAAPLTLPDSLPAPPVLADSLDALRAGLARANAAVRAAAAGREAAALDVRVARRSAWPVLFLSASHSWLENDALVHPHVNALAVGVSWDLFDGGVRRAEVSRAEARLTAAERARLEVERAAAVALEDAWRRWRQARREERTARRNVAAAEENLRIVEDQYRQGVARSNDVLDAEALLADSRFRVVDKHHDAYLAQARLLVAAGRDLVAFYATGSQQGSSER